MSNANLPQDNRSHLRNVLLVCFLLGLWLLGAVSGMLIFDLFKFINFRPKGHVLILVLLILASIVLMLVSYVLFPRDRDDHAKK